MKQTRRFPIRDKIFSLENIKTIAVKLDSTFSKKSGKEDYVSKSFKLFFEDETSLEDDSPAIFDEQPIKRVRAININLYTPNYHVQLDLIQRKYANSSFYISGTDIEWVNAVNADISELIGKSIKPQTTSIKKFGIPLGILAASGLAAIYEEILIVIATLVKKKPITFDITDAIIITVLWILWLISITNPLLNKLEEIWPSVELQLGPSHTLKELRIRNILAQICLVLVIPILIGYLLKYII